MHVNFYAKKTFQFHRNTIHYMFLVFVILISDPLHRLLLERCNVILACVDRLEQSIKTKGIQWRRKLSEMCFHALFARALKVQVITEKHCKRMTGCSMYSASLEESPTQLNISDLEPLF